MVKELFEVTENYITSDFHFQESDQRTFQLVYDEITSYNNKLVIYSTSEINDYKMKSIYRYADGFIVNEESVRILASLDIYNLSITPILIKDRKRVVENYFYIKVHSIINFIDNENTIFYREGDAFSLQSITILSNRISEKDRIFFIDDDYSIFMDKEIVSVLLKSNDLVVNSVCLN
ncbi:hypothetical protein BCU30_020605 [Vibrio lentus]|uniref:hypothetical protein n=1 Tax=Vibrio lentus TaxID=136468 RepID=UPI000C836BC6|nr:hypothetical protein [Vibrio lentus]PMG20399.1 hypothetical protein BCU96_23005 [Vibrio lentus]PMH15468.1 hypothetical protein BCU76_13210 [Vibrio lentus]PMI37419.1 hypothetical protein BCU45_24550 [Vibrio lentus]PMI62999.1 hypothetical protein BCU40_23855 [Vibrio lentus]PMJ06715.1 hypothetical protein BCU30_09665 [Vibrio lentus]